MFSINSHCLLRVDKGNFHMDSDFLCCPVHMCKLIVHCVLGISIILFEIGAMIWFGNWHFMWLMFWSWSSPSSTLAFRNLVAQVFAALLFFINNIEDLLNKYYFYITLFFSFLFEKG